MDVTAAVTAKTPWASAMGDIPMHLDYFEGSMTDKVFQTAEAYPGNVAFDFMGRSTTYRQMVREIERCAKALKTIGVRGRHRQYDSSPLRREGNRVLPE